MPHRLGRRAIPMLLATLVAAACGDDPAPTSSSAAHVPTVAPSATATPEPTPARPTFSPPPHEDGAFLDSVPDDVIEGFAATLIELYRDPTPARLAVFTDEGLASALRLDWRLRGAIDGTTSFRGEITLRGWQTTIEQGDASPPLLEAELAFAVAPGAALHDIPTGTVVQAWTERQFFGMRVAFRFDQATGLWQATAVAPPDLSLIPPPGTPDPPRPCPGLGPDVPDDADPGKDRIWCFGGEDGTYADLKQRNLLVNVPCGETRASVFSVGWPAGSVIDHQARVEFVRDPDGGFDERWPLSEPYDPDATPPADAYSTGLTDGEFELWVSPSAGDARIWMRHGDRFELWPRAPEWGVIDCN